MREIKFRAWIKEKKVMVLVKKPNFDWINPCTGEFFIELRKIGE